MREGKRCKDCKFYPDKCGYWVEGIRKKFKNATFLTEDTIHNCQDFSPKKGGVK